MAVKTYLHFLWFRLSKLLHDTAEFWKEDKWSFLGWIWICTSIGSCLGSMVFMAFNQTLGFILLVSSLCWLMVPILVMSGGYPILVFFIWVVRLPISIYSWFQERLENYRKWKGSSLER